MFTSSYYLVVWKLSSDVIGQNEYTSIWIGGWTLVLMVNSEADECVRGIARE